MICLMLNTVVSDMNKTIEDVHLFRHRSLIHPNNKHTTSATDYVQREYMYNPRKSLLLEIFRTFAYISGVPNIFYGVYSLQCHWGERLVSRFRGGQFTCCACTFCTYSTYVWRTLYTHTRTLGQYVECVNVRACTT